MKFTTISKALVCPFFISKIFKFVEPTFFIATERLFLTSYPEKEFELTGHDTHAASTQHSKNGIHFSGVTPACTFSLHIDIRQHSFTCGSVRLQKEYISHMYRVHLALILSLVTQELNIMIRFQISI